VAGGGAEQPRLGRAGVGGDGVQIRANLYARRAGGLADNEREPAGNAGSTECGAGGGAGAVPEPAAAGGVPELCAAGERDEWGAGGDARRPGDGHGDWPRGEGGAGGKGPPILAVRRQPTAFMCHVMTLLCRPLCSRSRRAVC